MDYPTITSRVNGMKIPLLRGQAGILHRFTTPENRLTISSVDEAGSTAQEPEKLIVGTHDDAAAKQANGGKEISL